MLTDRLGKPPRRDPLQLNCRRQTAALVEFKYQPKHLTVIRADAKASGAKVEVAPSSTRLPCLGVEPSFGMPLESFTHARPN